VTTAVGVLKRVPLEGPDADAYAQRMIRHHRVAQGSQAPADVVRATLLLQLNAFASGLPGVRPLLAERLVEVLALPEPPPVRVLGSVGQADLAPLADLSGEVFAEVELAAGEGLALITGNPFSTAWAALALADFGGLLDAFDVAGALSLEGLGANLSVLHPAVEAARPLPGLVASLGTLRRLLKGSAAWAPDASRNLQDPLTFRNVAHLHGAARDALAHARALLDIELNASQGNPIGSSLFEAEMVDDCRRLLDRHGRRLRPTQHSTNVASRLLHLFVQTGTIREQSPTIQILARTPYHRNTILLRDIVDLLPFNKQQRIAYSDDSICLVLLTFREGRIELADLPDSQPHELQAESI